MSADGRHGGTLEVVVTNTGTAPLSLPIGTDPVPLLEPSQHDRRFLTFSITSLADARGGFAESASNSEHPETSALLQPGDTVTFILPLSPGPDMLKAAQAGNGPRYRADLSLCRKVIDNGIDYNEWLGDRIRSENALPLP